MRKNAVNAGEKTGKMKTKIPRAAGEGRGAEADGEGAAEAGAAKKPTETAGTHGTAESATPLSAGGGRDSARKAILLFGA